MGVISHNRAVLVCVTVHVLRSAPTFANSKVFAQSSLGVRVRGRFNSSFFCCCAFAPLQRFPDSLPSQRRRKNLAEAPWKPGHISLLRRQLDLRPAESLTQPNRVTGHGRHPHPAHPTPTVLLQGACASEAGRGEARRAFVIYNVRQSEPGGRRMKRGSHSFVDSWIHSFIHSRCVCRLAPLLPQPTNWQQPTQRDDERRRTTTHTTQHDTTQHNSVVHHQSNNATQRQQHTHTHTHAHSPLTSPLTQFSTHSVLHSLTSPLTSPLTLWFRGLFNWSIGRLFDYSRFADLL